MKIRKFVLLIVIMSAMDKVFAYDFEVDGIYYDVVSLSEQTCKVVKRSSVYKYSGDIVIPAHVNHANKTLTVVEISEKLFYGCSGLTGITIPNTVASISNDMFNGCTKLKRVVIEDGRNVLRLGYNSYLFDDGDGYYSENLFCDCPITSLYIGRNISFDNESTFNDNNTIVELTIGNLVTEISGWMFCGCGSLKSVTIPNSVTEIGWFAFCGCTGLTEIVIPNSVTDIGDSAFSGCSGLKKLTIPNSVKSIGENAFGGCCGLTSLIIPNSITEIEYYTFGECSGLTDIVIPNTVTKIGGYAFCDCSSLTNLTIPESVTEIGDNVFESCGFTSITLPSSIKRIGAFDEADNITAIYILNPTPPSVEVDYDNEPFTKNQYMTLNVYVPQGSLEAYQNADVWKNFLNLQEGAPTGIDSAKNNIMDGNSKCYDLHGNRLSAPKRGLNIINGKKVIVK